MFERFTDRARRVVVLAQEEARMLSHDHIGTEHILLGLILEGEGVAARTLTSLGFDLQAVRRAVKAVAAPGQGGPRVNIPFTPRAKKVLELSLREALELGHNYIGTEHVLLGLMREGEGVGVQILRMQGADLEEVRERVVQQLAGMPAWGRESTPGGTGEVFARAERNDHTAWPLCPRCGASLQDSARYRVLDMQAALEEAPTKAVFVAFCGGCGTWLGTLT